MKNIGDLFNIYTCGLKYDDISVYTYNLGRNAISNVWSDSGYDISFREDGYYIMDKNEYSSTIKMSDISEVFCKNQDIDIKELLKIYGDDEYFSYVKDIEFDFNNNSMYLVIY